MLVGWDIHTSQFTAYVYWFTVMRCIILNCREIQSCDYIQNFKSEFVSCTDLLSNITIWKKHHHPQSTLLFRPLMQAPAHHLAMVKIIKYWLCTQRTAHGVNSQNWLSCLSRVLMTKSSSHFEGKNIWSQVIFLGHICIVLPLQWLCWCFPWPTHSIWIHDPCNHHRQLHCPGTGAASAS